VKLSVGRSAGPPGAGSLSLAYWQHRPNTSSYFSARDSASRVSMTTPLDFAAPFVTGTVALLWSEFPRASAATVRAAVTGARGMRRTTVVPPLLDAWAAYEVLNGSGG
jgi:hypothetical protein